MPLKRGFVIIGKLARYQRPFSQRTVLSLNIRPDLCQLSGGLLISNCKYLVVLHGVMARSVIYTVLSNSGAPALILSQRLNQNLANDIYFKTLLHRRLYKSGAYLQHETVTYQILPLLCKGTKSQSTI